MAMSGSPTAASAPWQRFLLPLLALLSVALTVVYVVDVRSASKHVSPCEMTWSWPVYSELDWVRHPTYKLHAVHMHEYRPALTGVPVLFIPGHLGSHKQARSIARHLWDIDPELFDVFALDFNDELTGLSGQFVLDQATFTNDAVRAIVRQYKKQNKASQGKGATGPRPDAVVVVAHSMGGVVIRVAESLPNHLRQSVQHVVTLGTPFEAPPFPFDADMQSAYGRMRSVRVAKPQPIAGAMPGTPGGRRAQLLAGASAASASSAVYVSLSGGHKDVTIHSSMSRTDSVVPSSHAFVSLSTAMPQVKATMDHLCLLWCHQLMKAVATSLRSVTDVKTRELIKDPVKRLALAQEVLLGIDGDVLLHRDYVLDGYHPEEYGEYRVLLPRMIWHTLRVHHMQLFLVMYAVLLYVFYRQLAAWQQAFNLQDGPPVVGQRKFPAFTDMLHPAAHAPAFVESLVQLVQAKFPGSASAVIATTTVALVALVAECTRRHQGLRYVAVEVGTLAFLYVISLGLLYAVAIVLWLVCRFVLAPVFVLLDAFAARARLRRWMVFLTVFALLGLVVHVRYDVDPCRSFALLVLGSVLSLLLQLVALGARSDATSDHRRYQLTLCGVLLFSTLAWAGKVVYFVTIVHSPPLDISNDVFTDGLVLCALAWLFIYALGRVTDEMAPVPPTAFFGASNARDAAVIFGDNTSNDSTQVTAENCPKCIFEDGGPGAVLVEYRTTQTLKIQTPTEVVYVGPTFRVVSCDCVFRYDRVRDYCDFCVRSCRLCGGGAGNHEQAAKYRDYLEEIKSDVAKHAFVPLAILLMAMAQVTIGRQSHHWMFYISPTIVLMLLAYHTWLRHILEVRRMRKIASSKNKSKSSASKKKKKRKSTGAGSGTSTKVPTADKATSTSKDSPVRQSTIKTMSSTTSTASKARGQRSFPMFGEPIMEEITPPPED
ncbi:TPA: hypothetical protein N0F65_005249 [Lagenidium giganteum]|uniref:GPI inositol-deacylase n=1 Tax=Lagenidium giganteum TaxID=4803 RepID=A0AAV2YTS8_9STRA|nr:TPA: hypothetical protein N0F65_005249 [Lagenidium giganteum]